MYFVLIAWYTFFHDVVWLYFRFVVALLVRWQRSFLIIYFINRQITLILHIFVFFIIMELALDSFSFVYLIFYWVFDLSHLLVILLFNLLNYIWDAFLWVIFVRALGFILKYQLTLFIFSPLLVPIEFVGVKFSDRTKTFYQ